MLCPEIGLKAVNFCIEFTHLQKASIPQLGMCLNVIISDNVCAHLICRPRENLHWNSRKCVAVFMTGFWLLLCTSLGNLLLCAWRSSQAKCDVTVSMRTSINNFSAITPSVTWCNWCLGYDVRGARKTVLRCARLLLHRRSICNIVTTSKHSLWLMQICNLFLWSTDVRSTALMLFPGANKVATLQTWTWRHLPDNRWFAWHDASRFLVSVRL